MRISFNPIINKYTQSFGTKKPEIRKADDIQRKTRDAIPFFSPSYAKSNYSSQNNPEASDLRANQAEKLHELRCRRYEEETPNTPLSKIAKKTIQDTKQMKLANCGEAAIITMSALIANGFPNTHRCAVVLNTSIVDKRTNREIYSKDYDLDHACVVTTMDKNPRIDKPYIVVDLWDGFADSTSGAVSRYRKLVSKEALRDYNFSTLESYKRENHLPKKTNMSGYKIRNNIDFAILDSPNKTESRKICQYIRTECPDLVFESEEE